MTETMPQEFWQGVEQFNSGQFYACHDTLEALWIEASEPDKTFYQGILQIAVGLYHLGNDNLRGAAILLGEGGNRLRRYPDSYGGIDVEELLSESAALLKVIQQMGASKVPVGNLGENQVLPIPRIVLTND
jgi:predicted metal-dependent hydrolase